MLLRHGDFKSLIALQVGKNYSADKSDSKLHADAAQFEALSSPTTSHIVPYIRIITSLMKREMQLSGVNTALDKCVPAHGEVTTGSRATDSNDDEDTEHFRSEQENESKETRGEGKDALKSLNRGKQRQLPLVLRLPSHSTRKLGLMGHTELKPGGLKRHSGEQRGLAPTKLMLDYGILKVQIQSVVEDNEDGTDMPQE
ncbi:elongation factor 1-beta-like [Ictidomys tridecemlineatus]